MIYIDQERCKGCELCAAFCPKHLITMEVWFNSSGFHPAVLKKENAGDCNSCGICALMCPEMAITVLKEEKESKKRNIVYA